MVLNANYCKDQDQMGNTPITNSANVALQESEGLEKQETQPGLIDWRTIWKPLGLIVGLFLVFFWLPLGNNRFTGAVIESLALVHRLFCIPGRGYEIPGCRSKKSAGLRCGIGIRLYSCGVLLYGLTDFCRHLETRRGVGTGHCVSLFRSGCQCAGDCADRKGSRPCHGHGSCGGGRDFQHCYRADHAFSLIMHFLFIKEETAKAQAALHMPEPEVERPLWQNVLYFATMVFILISATWGKPAEPSGLWNAVYSVKWLMTGIFAAILGVLLIAWFKVKPYKVVLAGTAVLVLAVLFPHEPLIAFSAGIIGLVWMITTTRGETENWFLSSWDFTKQIMPLLFAGVLAAGLLLGRPGSEGLISSRWVSSLVGGNSLGANLFASVAGAFMYFATLTEVPILQGLMSSGMGNGPALALLLAGPALSLPNMLVIRSVLGTKKTVAYIILVVIMSTISGMIFGHYFSEYR